MIEEHSLKCSNVLSLRKVSRNYGKIGSLARSEFFASMVDKEDRLMTHCFDVFMEDVPRLVDVVAIVDVDVVVVAVVFVLMSFSFSYDVKTSGGSDGIFLSFKLI